MRAWFAFLLFPLLIFVFLFFFYVIFLLSLTLGCGFHQENIPTCSKIYYFSIISIFPIAIWFGYFTTKLVPHCERYLLSSIYNLMFSITLFTYLQSTKISLIFSIGFSLLFLLCLGSGGFIFYLKYKKR
ncbi:hypothetical protein NDM229_013015 [Acinetobacter bereziniae]|nr:hypothetical protein NDM229_013015 [Acinetobacter bereziniae]